jgi:hypothetical protein
MQEREDTELMLFLGTVEDEIGTEEHMVGKFVTLGLKALISKVENKSAHA